jgi:hypothetical protein
VLETFLIGLRLVSESTKEKEEKKEERGRGKERGRRRGRGTEGTTFHDSLLQVDDQCGHIVRRAHDDSLVAHGFAGLQKVFGRAQHDFGYVLVGHYVLGGGGEVKVVVVVDRERVAEDREQNREQNGEQNREQNGEQNGQMYTNLQRPHRTPTPDTRPLSPASSSVSLARTSRTAANSRPLWLATPPISLQLSTAPNV